MKQLLLFFALFIFSQAAFGQSCKYSKDVTDPFTGEKIKETYAVFGPRSELRFQKCNSQYKIFVTFPFWDIVKDSLKKSDSLLIKLNDGAILKFSLKAYSYSYRRHRRARSSRLFAEYTIDNNQMAALANGHIIYIRVNAGLRTPTFKIKPTQAADIAKASGCIMQ